ncbi:MAG: acyltransferase [Myxococcota bacterium]
MSPGAWLDAHFLRRTSSSNEQVDALDGLRGIAVALVVASHLSNLGLHPLPGADFQGTGKYGVYLFFVLSAFLLTRPLVAPGAAFGGAAAWRRYAARRALRIFPLYWVVLAVNWGFTEVWPTQAFPSLTSEQWVRHMLLREGKGVYWTIPVELAFYLAIPVYALLVRALGGRLVPVTLATAAIVAASSALFPPGDTPNNSVWIGWYLPVFAAGSYAAFLDHRIPRARTLAGDAVAAAGLAAVVAAFPSVARAATGADVDKTFLHTAYLPFGIAWSAVVLGALRARGPLARALESRALRLAGVVSFSVYLWHVPVLRALAMLRIPQPQATAWLVVGASLALALGSYAAIERPFLRGPLARRLGRGRS